MKINVILLFGKKSSCTNSLEIFEDCVFCRKIVNLQGKRNAIESSMGQFKSLETSHSMLLEGLCLKALMRQVIPRKIQVQHNLNLLAIAWHCIWLARLKRDDRLHLIFTIV